MKTSPKKSLGQNFLINDGVLTKIVSAAELTKNDIVVEVGPGTGNLTSKLAEKAGYVFAIEKDYRLIKNLQEKFEKTNVEIVEGDVLELGTETLTGNWKLETGNFKIVANIPYYITSNFLRIIFEKWPKPKLVVLTVQKEVAQRIMAKPPHMNPERSREGSQRASTSYGMNLLALSVQFYSSPTIIGYVSKGSFRPIPKVDSAIIKIIPKKDTPADKDIFFKLIKAGFAGKRKQLANNLSKNLGLPKDKVIGILKELGLDEKIRAENLSMDKWAELSSFL